MYDDLTSRQLEIFKLYYGIYKFKRLPPSIRKSERLLD